MICQNKITYFKSIHVGQFLLVWPGLLHLEHFLVVLEPVLTSVLAAVEALCSKMSCSAPTIKKLVQPAGLKLFT